MIIIVAIISIKRPTGLHRGPEAGDPGQAQRAETWGACHQHADHGKFLSHHRKRLENTPLQLDLSDRSHLKEKRLKP